MNSVKRKEFQIIIEKDFYFRICIKNKQYNEYICLLYNKCIYLENDYGHKYEWL